MNFMFSDLLARYDFDDNLFGPLFLLLVSLFSIPALIICVKVFPCGLPQLHVSQLYPARYEIPEDLFPLSVIVVQPESNIFIMLWR